MVATHTYPQCEPRRTNMECIGMIYPFLPFSKPCFPRTICGMSVLRFALQPGGCALLPFDTVAGRCARCGNGLSGQIRWCSITCEQQYLRNHNWNMARQAALERDDHCCVKCGWMPEACGYLDNGQFVLWSRSNLTLEPEANWLEVNHIIPRRGAGYDFGCHHHLATLETLCHQCHVKVTRRQRRQWSRPLAV
jgi:hypothetical protein